MGIYQATVAHVVLECTRQVVNLYGAGLELHAAATVRKSFPTLLAAEPLFKQLETYLHEVRLTEFKQLVAALYGEFNG